MDLKLSMEQLREIIRLARKCQESTPTGWVTAQEILNHTKEVLSNPDSDYNVLCNYLKRLTYDEVLEVEALMDYGGEVLAYSKDNRESLEACYNYIQAQYGGKKGNIEMAIEYIVGKNYLAHRLEAALDDIAETT